MTFYLDKKLQQVRSNTIWRYEKTQHPVNFITTNRQQGKSYNILGRQVTQILSNVAKTARDRTGWTFRVFQSWGTYPMITLLKSLSWDLSHDFSIETSLVGPVPWLLNWNASRGTCPMITLLKRLSWDLSHDFSIEAFLVGPVPW